MGVASAKPSENADLSQLLRWWRQEQDDACKSQREERFRRAWPERLEGGLALTGLVFARREQRGERDPMLWFRREDDGPLPKHRLRSGWPALLWPASLALHGEPPEASQQQAVGIVRITAAQVCLRFPKRYERFVEDVALNLERETSEVTFRRGEDAVISLLQDGSLATKRSLLFGDGVPGFDEARDIAFRDERLNLGQRQAVAKAVCARDAALIVGPPGTGKTRTLVEVVRQALLLRRRILVTAASNVATDNLARHLAACRVHVLRLGASDKVSPDLSACTLSHKMAQLPEMAQAQEHFDAAQRIADGQGRRIAQPGKRIAELRRQAHSCRDQARAKVMRRSRVVCSTAGGVDAVPLGDEKFDLVVLDEATQAPDPVALAALERGAVLVMAGDPAQLPPTVVSQDEATRAGLSSTLFERCSARWPEAATTTLTVQYRMSEQLMSYPSQAHYGGRLEAAEGNRDHRLEDLLGERLLSERDALPWIVIDTRAIGNAEAFDDRGSSYYNDVHRKLVAQEIGRLVALGIEASDIAAICPYTAQTRRLRQELTELCAQGLEIGTVDGFQGREKEVVIVDLVRSNANRQLGFLRDVRRTNVAITRAKRQLLIVLDGATVEKDAYYGELLAAAKRAGAWELATPAQADVRNQKV